MDNLFGDELPEAPAVARLTDAYREKLLNNPPTPAFMATNPNREGFARHIAKKDVTRFLAVLAECGLTIRNESDLG